MDLSSSWQSPVRRLDQKSLYLGWRLAFNRAGFAKGIDYESRCHTAVVSGSLILIFGFGGRHAADGFQQPTMVEPVHPFNWGIFDDFEAEFLCMIIRIMLNPT